MTPESKADNSWDRVAAELRACRDAQHQAWGDIDNLTLGRFLAGDVTSDEQKEIESALDSLPELRKLTDLVRDVLGETDTAPPPRQQPTILSTREYERPTVRSWPLRPSARRQSKVRQYAVLATAACLLLALGVGLPRAGRTTNPEPGASVAFFHPVAERIAPFDADQAVAMLEPKHDVLLLQSNPFDRKRLEEPLVRANASMQDLQAKGQKREAESLARQYVSNWTRQARIYQEQGDFVRAEPALSQARLLSNQTLGPNAPESVRTRKSLAGLYVAALDTPPTASVSFARNDSKWLRSAPMGKRSTENQPIDPSRRIVMAPAPGVSHFPAQRATFGDDPTKNARPMFMASSTGSPADSKGAYALPSRSGYRVPEYGGSAELRQRIRKQKLTELRDCVVPVLAQSLRDAKEPSERQRLARALGQLGPAAGGAVPALLDAYRKAGDVSERVALVSALGQIGSPARSAAPVLVEALHSREAEVRQAAARALVLLGPATHGWRKDFVKHPVGDPLVVELLHRLDAPEGRSGIDDDAGCFSVEAIQQARDSVRRLAKRSGYAIRIETVADEAARKEKSKATPDDQLSASVCIRVEKQPANTSVFVSEKLRKRGLSDTAVRQKLAPYLRVQDFDGALRAGIQFLDEFEKRQPQK